MCGCEISDPHFKYDIGNHLTSYQNLLEENALKIRRIHLIDGLWDLGRI